MIDRDKVCEIWANANCTFSFPSSLREEGWVVYNQEHAKLVYEDFFLHFAKIVIIVDKELRRTETVWDEEKRVRVPSKRKIIKKNIEKALHEAEVTKALWDLMLRSNAITESDDSRKYFPKTAFYVITLHLQEIVDELKELL